MEKSQAEIDHVSRASCLEDEIDEWAALNKYQLYKDHQQAQERRTDAKQRQQNLREELYKQ